MRHQKSLVLGLVILLSISGFTAALASTDTVNKKDRGKIEEQGENDRSELKDNPDLPWPQRGQNPQNTRRSSYTTKYIDHSVTWKHGFAKNSSMTLVGKDGPVYIDPLEEKQGSEIVFLNSSNGSVKKRVRVDPENLQMIALTPNGILTGSNKTMYAFDRNGKKRWNLTLFGTVEEWSGKYEDGAIYIVAENSTTYDNKLYCINSQGKIQWTLLDIIEVAVGDDGVVYAGNESALYALEQGAKEKWNVSFGGDAGVRQISIGPQGTIYINEEKSGKVHAVDKTGEIKWSKDLSNNYIWGPAIAENGNIYVTSWAEYGEGAKLYCLNPDGKILWNFSEDKREMNHPRPCALSPIVGRDGRIYFTAFERSIVERAPWCNFILVCISPDGDDIWNHTYGGDAAMAKHFSFPIIGRYGKVYQSIGNQLHTFGYNTTPLPSRVKDLKVESTEEKVKLSWNKTPEEKPLVTGYRIYRGSSAEDLDFLTEINGTTYTDTGFTQGQTYHYRVSAVNVFGEGNLSAEVSVTPSAEDGQNGDGTDNGTDDGNEDTPGFTFSILLISVFLALIYRRKIR